MFTVLILSHHVVPTSIEGPVHKDDVGNGALDLRRRWTRRLRTWEIVVPGVAQDLDPIGGLLDVAQGDNPMWFDGGGTLEVVEPILVGIGDSSRTDFALPHRNVFVASTVIYLNGAATHLWGALGDGITMDTFRFFTPPGMFAQIRAKYRRKAKVVLDTESEDTSERVFRDLSDNSRSVYQRRFFLREVPN